METSRFTIDVARYDAYTGKQLPNGDLEMVTIDWNKTGFPAAIIKSSEGTVPDKAFFIQWDAAKQANIPRIAYHYFRTDVNAIQQARKQQAILEYDFQATDYIAVDFEKLYGGVTGPDSLKALGSFLYEWEHAGLPADRIFIYTGASFWYTVGGQNAGWAAKYRLWVAHWPWDLWLLDVIKLPPYVWSDDLMTEKQLLILDGKVIPANYKPFYGEIKPWGFDWSIWQFTARLSPKSINGYYANKKAVDFNFIRTDLPGMKPPPVNPPTCPTCGQVWVK